MFQISTYVIWVPFISGPRIRVDEKPSRFPLAEKKGEKPSLWPLRVPCKSSRSVFQSRCYFHQKIVISKQRRPKNGTSGAAFAAALRRSAQKVGNEKSVIILFFLSHCLSSPQWTFFFFFVVSQWRQFGVLHQIHFLLGPGAASACRRRRTPAPCAARCSLAKRWRGNLWPTRCYSHWYLFILLLL